MGMEKFSRGVGVSPNDIPNSDYRSQVQRNRQKLQRVRRGWRHRLREYYIRTLIVLTARTLSNTQIGRRKQRPIIQCKELIYKALLCDCAQRSREGMPGSGEARFQAVCITSKVISMDEFTVSCILFCLTTPNQAIKSITRIDFGRFACASE